MIQQGCDNLWFIQGKYFKSFVDAAEYEVKGQEVYRLAREYLERRFNPVKTTYEDVRKAVSASRKTVEQTGGSFVAYHYLTNLGKQYLTIHGSFRNQKILDDPKAGYDLKEFTCWRDFQLFCRKHNLTSEEYFFESIAEE